ncbi:MAG TPA: Crp/Fnr family transcriptional regulator [Acidobacteriaceae bacterium]|jgi:CRP-like cAMP-binding protein|nr:Crp/Fnr family transcriptional regulator [Acidobacteriaceae bacterium]
MTSVNMRNEFLAALPETDRTALLDTATQVELPARFSFYAPGELPQAIYFLESGMASELVRMSDGRTIDGSPTGRYGFVGVPAVLGATDSFHQGVMQVPGEGLRVPIGVVQELYANSESFGMLAGRFLHARFLQAIQCAACNLLHNMKQRMARWLLTTRMHTGTEEFHISQEYLSEMIGANRSTVTQCLGALEREGLVRLDRGAINIAHYNALRHAACECYGVIEAAFAQLMTEETEGREQKAV